MCEKLLWFRRLIGWQEPPDRDAHCANGKPTPERFRELDELDPGPYPLNDAGDEMRY